MKECLNEYDMMLCFAVSSLIILITKPLKDFFLLQVRNLIGSEPFQATKKGIVDFGKDSLKFGAAYQPSVG